MQFIAATQKMASLDPCLKNAKWWKPPQNWPSPAHRRFEIKCSWIFQEPINRGKYAYAVTWVKHALGKKIVSKILHLTQQTWEPPENNSFRLPIHFWTRKGIMFNGPFFTIQRTTLIEYLTTVLKRRENLWVLAHVQVNVPMMSSLSWYSNMSGPWASKPRFLSLRSQTEPFFTTGVENRTLPIICEFLWNRSDTNHFYVFHWELRFPFEMKKHVIQRGK